MAAILESIGVGIVACDAHGVLTLFNEATRTFHGLPEQPLFAEQWAEHYALYEADGTTPMAVERIPLFRALQGEHVRNAEMMIIAKQGRARTLVAEGRALHDRQGHPLGAVVAMHDISERKRAEEALRHQALHDDLTGLPNRMLLQDRLSKAILTGQRDNTAVALLLIDLDRFKEINDTFGHHYGDLLLQQVGPRLAAVLRGSDTVARLGGDEFAVLLPGTDSSNTVPIAQLLLRALEVPFVPDGQGPVATLGLRSGAGVFHGPTNVGLGPGSLADPAPARHPGPAAGRVMDTSGRIYRYSTTKAGGFSVCQPRRSARVRKSTPGTRVSRVRGYLALWAASCLHPN